MTSPNHLSSDIVASIPTGLLIGGEWRKAASTFAVHDPATTEVITEIGNGTAADGIAALDAAADSFAAWRAVAPREKAELLRAVFDRLIAQADVAAAIVTAEGGKPLAEARAEVTYAAEYIRWYSEQAVRLGGLARKAPGGANHQLVLSKPVGPALLITPWNFPIAMITRKIAPALAAGCPVVIKPAQLTPLTTQWVAELFRSELEHRGLPTGVVNVVPTSSSRALTEPIMADPRLRKISFTGSTEVGRTLLRQAAAGVLRTSMELGGNAPFLVFDDADIPAAVAGAVAAKMRNAGQTCVAANRFIVQAGVAEEFAAQLTVAFDQLVVGHGAAAGTTVGPLIESSAVDHVESLVTAAVADGATVRTGGSRPDLPGYFYSPTVISGVTPESLVATDEVFGPVAPIITFGTEAEGVAIANGTEFGLAGYAFTRDISRAMRLTEELEVGILGINRGMVSDASAPFGGVKSSGLGREGGEAGIEDYLEHMYVAL